jgi:hypothetical protein
MYVCLAPPTLDTLLPQAPARRNSLLERTPNHDEIAERLRETAHAEARQHVQLHGHYHYVSPGEIGKLAHVLALLRFECDLSDGELRQFSDFYWNEREAAAEFLAQQLALF